MSRGNWTPRTRAIEAAMEVAAVASRYATLREHYRYSAEHPEVEQEREKVARAFVRFWERTATAERVKRSAA